MSPETLADLLSTLRAALGDRATVADAVRDHHSHGESYHAASPPDIVVFPQSTGEVQQVVRACAERRVPIVPFGAGTSIEGQVAAVCGGVCIDLSRMTQVVRVSVADLDATVEAGVTHRQLNHHLRNTGLAFFVDPGADATIAGMAATRASGTTAVRYGTMRENVLGMTVVLADGRAIHTGTRARKSSAGYDLTRLFVGSEGTLGVITDVTVRLHPRPEAIATAVCHFPTIKQAVDTVIATIQLGVPVARIELLDEVQMDAINRYASLTYAASPTLFLEFHGSSDDAVREQVETVEGLAADAGGAGFVWVTTPEDRARLWKARHDAYYAALALRPGSKGWTTDVCVPISALADAIVAAKEDVAASSLLASMVSHAGDGNFHIVFLIDPTNASELAEVERLSASMVDRALAAGGTCTGEHGVGLGKRHYLPLEHGDGVDVMRAIKHALDPHDLMNPGKMLL